ncbi:MULTISPECIES: TetR/AcrR family transcriptional regulator [Nocardiopsis]|uniref:Transcriptional regulator, TetR family n=1 Tax=Nocardiopsis dassonvillei (strain ATCC 23218 / DSM 43111 / CIP 107115 / JCM 7437 / KCTC 9190 / NBRC 14626 / NCTC 10488 / NRRL B-5397 / IMRU 509) TaxID=446468 RepID=D7B1B8_NOCDD|nr:TetR/AcrR family transcriptional regulator [Nocardiopsis dassonvillei]ADH66509.1 transcriptional regulator, TetR family [Nocardiopsis dassonvillei subsp. dassonvillei DSM 43111]APC34818.1 TetR family transcriptional regulator [Nocardiopsis dassonvillei]NKY79937.1 TetR/AcrR family transcriptional regulator [Nocardiopsis dassonvillei]VEI92530.1 transcriptional regulator BetI [Nocardiopsis dassonvillei]
MRKSNRTQILDAAFRVVQRDGVRALTYESVAAETGLTKGGLLYHFPSRESLLQALHEHLAQGWDDHLAEAAGRSADRATPRERLAAYARVAAHSSTRAELLLLLETANEPATRAPWDEVMGRWTSEPSAGPLTPEEMELFVLRLAADGLWLYESLSSGTLPPPLRRQVAEHLASAIAPGQDRDAEPDREAPVPGPDASHAPDAEPEPGAGAR